MFAVKMLLQLEEEMKKVNMIFWVSLKIRENETGYKRKHRKIFDQRSTRNKHIKLEYF